MPNDTLAQAVARAMCGSPEICPACMEEAHGVIAAIRAAGFAIIATEGPDFDAAYERAFRSFVDHPHAHGSLRAAIRAALNLTGETDA